MSVRLRASFSYKPLRPRIQTPPLRYGPSSCRTPFSTSPLNCSQWDESKPYVSFQTLSGLSRQSQHSNVKHTPKANLNKLIPALNELLSWGPGPLWKLSAGGDALLHEVHGYSSKEQAEEIVAGIVRIGDEMNHHADTEIIHAGAGNPGNKDFWPGENVSAGTRDDDRPWFLKIRCTTHKPAGLGMRDVELARKISAILH